MKQVKIVVTNCYTIETENNSYCPGFMQGNKGKLDGFNLRTVKSKAMWEWRTIGGMSVYGGAMLVIHHFHIVFAVSL